MPGQMLEFKCPCGFIAEEVIVGATETHHHLVVLCLDCHRLFSIRRSHREENETPVCRNCKKPLMQITDKGAWAPQSLQDKFPDDEPWMIDAGSGGYSDEEPTDEEIAELESIAVLCPACHSYTLKYETVAFWD